MKKYILITGVSSGIGHGLSKFFLSQGFSVIGTVRNHKDANDLESISGFHKIIYDVTNKEDLPTIITKIKYIINDGVLHGLINNAGIAVAGPLELVSEEEFYSVMEINVFAVRRITNAVLPLMKEGSRIVMISSVSGIFNSPFTGPYSISKHAIESMCDIYRRELLLFGIKVIALEPGPIKSEIWGKAKGIFKKYEDSRYAQWVKNGDKIIENAEKSAIDVQYVCDAANEAMTNSSPKARYIVHKNKFIFKIFAKLLPDGLTDYLVSKGLKKGEKHRIV
jgi:NAD(P)-dependent dehydrogenase (short-subunit alcohol dehydrogenase family)